MKKKRLVGLLGFGVCTTGGGDLKLPTYLPHTCEGGAEEIL